MDWKDPKIWLGAAGVGVVGYLLLRAPSGGDGFTQPSLISYVSPGSPDAVIDGTGSGAGANTGGSSTADALAEATRSSNETTLSIANTETTLAGIQGLVASQVNRLNFSSEYGFNSQITGGLTLDGAGSPQFTLNTRFTPNDPSNTTRALTTANRATANARAARDRVAANLAATRERLAELRTRLTTTVRPVTPSTRPSITGPRPVSPAVTSFPRPIG